MTADTGGAGRGKQVSGLESQPDQSQVSAALAQREVHAARSSGNPTATELVPDESIAFYACESCEEPWDGLFSGECAMCLTPICNNCRIPETQFCEECWEQMNTGGMT